MPRLVLLSDTHNRHKWLHVPEGDILIHAGDATWEGSEKEIDSFLTWMSRLPHAHKILIAGNHDEEMERTLIEARGIRYLEYEAIEVRELLVYGGPFYTVRDERLKKKEKWAAHKISETWAEHALREAPRKLDVLITHRPPYGILDVADEKHGGSSALLAYVHEVRPRLHVFGHVHEGRGQVDRWSTAFVNAAAHSDRELGFLHDPFIIDLEK